MPPVQSCIINEWNSYRVLARYKGKIGKSVVITAVNVDRIVNSMIFEYEDWRICWSYC
jgi:hypothetical protein